MMKSSSVVGMPVCLRTGEQLGVVKLVVFDPEQHLTLGFLVGWGGWAGSAQVLPWSWDVSVSSKAIEVSSRHQIVPASQAPLIKQVLEASSLSKGTPITTADGHMAGILHDVQFDLHTRLIRGYEMVFTQLDELAGQHTLLTPEQVVYVPDEASLNIRDLTAVQLQEMAQKNGEQLY